MRIDETPRATSRRSLAKGMAWSLAVVASAQAAPLVAASGEPVVPTTASGACKYNVGQSLRYYRFSLVFQNNSTVASTVCITSGTMTPNGCPSVGINPTTFSPGQCVIVPPGGTTTIVVDSYPASCQAQGTMTLTYTYTFDGATYTTTTDVTISSVDPCKK